MYEKTEMKATTPESGEITSSIKDVQKVLYVATEAAIQLSVRLKPVLRPTYPQDNNVAMQPDGSCELHGMIIDIHAKIADLIRTLDDLNSRVAL